MKKKAIAVLSITGIFILLGFYLYPRTSPEQAFYDFQTTPHKESYIVVPLCNAGKEVIPLVIEKIQDKDLERRRYAIGFLGSANDIRAISVLEKIVNDESDGEYYRGDALDSIYLIDETKGLKLAEKYKNQSDYLGNTAKEVLEEKNYSEYKKTTQTEICNPTD